ncbi:glycosyltransferase family 2 protein [Nesterenkonia alba]|uniref:glycosyltransferase family 2 protein n=1 Tax=Nesterenkonia alba TaxID=515814 RepID=UPI0003B6C76A|nr:glycosyltransferase family 2 protein [Nesterenkonia alba]
MDHVSGAALEENRLTAEASRYIGTVKLSGELLLRGRLLEHYLHNAGDYDAGLERTALRSESTHMRELLAHDTSHGTLSNTELREAVLNGTLSPYSVDPEALGRLAYVTALQDIYPEDGDVATAMLELLSTEFHRTVPGRRYNKLLADLYFEQRRFDDLDTLLAERPDIQRNFFGYIGVDVHSPFVRGHKSHAHYQRWLEGFNRPFRSHNLVPLHLRDGDEVPFNRLTTPPLHGPQPEGPLVTVIMTSYKPIRDDILASARSILDQSWQNLELLVVDDASGEKYAPILDELEALDPRLRVIRLTSNGGTYAARNVGIDHAQGSYITGQDADDWSHPQRIETQVNYLQRNPRRPGNQVYTVNMTEDLVRIRRGYSPFIPSAPTLMARTHIMKELGGYIPARKASDNELRDRVSAYSTATGGAEVYAIAEPLIFMRILPNSLSRSDFRPGWQHPARRAFWSAYKTWHATANPQQLRRSAHHTDPIYIPPRFTSPPEKTTALDVVVVADWCEYGETQAAAIEEIRHLTTTGRRVGILHLENAIHLSQYARVYCEPIEEFIRNGEVTHVLADEDFHDVDTVLVRQPELLQFMPHHPAAFRPRQVIAVADKAPAEPTGFSVYYLPAECAAHGAEFFGTRPHWVATSAEARTQLEKYLPPNEISGHTYHTVFSAERWVTPRRRPRNTRPVIGRWAGESATHWPTTAETISTLWPTDGRYDIRFYGDPSYLLRLLGYKRLPAAWLSFRQQDITRETYYRSLDFFVHYPQPATAERAELPVLEAMAAGCLVILPPGFSPVYGDAALYASPEQVHKTITEHTEDTQRYLAQSRRGVEFAAHYGTGGYGELMNTLLGAPAADAHPRTQEAPTS